MIESDGDKRRVVPLAGAQSEDEELPFCVELWDAAQKDTVERVLARAYSAQLAHAIFKAATGEHPDRRITLRRGEKMIADTAAPTR
ncbi:MAG TPA: hypothetical protein VFB45_25105 [Pseudolabrys sp.]|nr:hypothetical protein [Pseudolabrys sp.]